MGKYNSAKNTGIGSVKKPLQLSKQGKIDKSRKRHRSRVGNELDDVDSLAFLKGTKERQKQIGIDDKIKFLKTELMSLLGSTVKDRNSNSFTRKDASIISSNSERGNSETLEVDISSGNCMKPREPLIDESEAFKPNLNFTPSKFSEWLENTIDDMESKSKKKKFEENESETNLQFIINPMFKIPPLNLMSPDSHFSSFSPLALSQQKVEQLLYKSFLIQNSDLQLSAFEQSDLNQIKPIGSPTQNDGKFTSSVKPNNSEFVKSDFGLKTKKRFPQRVKKRNKMNPSLSQTEVEVINLDSSSANSPPNTNIVCIDLDISNYDWDEPFVVPGNTESYSVQVEESDEQIMYQPDIKSDAIEVKENNKSSSVDNKNFENKKIWECPICFEPSKGQEIVTTQCGHVFCKKCLKEHLSKVKNNCPSCRCSLRSKPYITLFNF